MDNRRLIIAVVACIVIILGWQGLAQYMGWLPEPTPPQPAAEQTAPAPVPTQPAPAAIVPQVKFVPSEGREVRVDTPLYTAVFHSGGGVLQSFTLKHYKANLLPDSPDLNMVTPAAATVAPMGLLINGQPSWNMGQWSFDGSDITLKDGDAKLTFQGELNGIRILREITFHASTYLMDEKVTLTPAAGSVARMSYNLGSTNFSSENQYDVMSMAWNLKGSLDRDTDVEDLTKEGVMANGDIYWAGTMSNYFLSAVIPEKGQNTVFKGRITEGGVWRTAVELSDVALTAGQPTTLSTSWWLGPKSRDLLAAAPNDLKSSIDMGIFSFVAVPLLKLLTLFESFMGNWGLAIILLTILIKIVFWPLSRKSFKSMEQMKKLQPMMKQLQEKHKGDKEALSREMMQLYKTYGVNPMGGCLPILIQLPVFVALYQALLNCIELRHASFITYLPGTDLLWLADLSVKDPFYITPLIMGATMFLQQWLSPAMGDPQQRKIMLIMPVVFTVMFINFPSGLVLYWLCNNILSILQQSWTLHRTK
ncbi:membrane protein insertase YidC [uncultured Mailhella sp.]|uniref:membrane protein insertase YidC n=1 Tax=uncultured Mailhella sp. TaxID=1981031 RepID=UPI0026244D05|nr:membrane protein insertase YidC [uncultured Mailhella sp.]